MNSPFARKAQQLAAEAALPDSNWLHERKEAVQEHTPSLEIGLRALGDMAALLLNGRISTNLRIEHALDLKNIQPADELGYVACSVVPSLSGTPRGIPLGRGFSWTPDVALQLSFSLKDRYDRAESATRRLQPTGDVSLYMNARTWGRIPEEEASAINQLGENIWTTYGDNGHSRNGTQVQAVFKRGELLTRELAEILLAPLAPHVVDYFALTHKDHLADWQQPGNFSDANQHDDTPRFSNDIFDVHKMIGQ